MNLKNLGVIICGLSISFLQYACKPASRSDESAIIAESQRPLISNKAFDCVPRKQVGIGARTPSGASCENLTEIWIDNLVGQNRNANFRVACGKRTVSWEIRNHHNGGKGNGGFDSVLVGGSFSYREALKSVLDKAEPGPCTITIGPILDPA